MHCSFGATYNQYSLEKGGTHRRPSLSTYSARGSLRSGRFGSRKNVARCSAELERTERQPQLLNRKIKTLVSHCAHSHIPYSTVSISVLMYNPSLTVEIGQRMRLAVPRHSIAREADRPMYISPAR